MKSGGTPSYDTGPVGDHTTNSSSGKYLYTEASYCTEGEHAWLLSPCYELNSLSVDSLSFWYHMYGDDIDTLHLDVFDGNIWWNDVFFLAGQQQTSDTAAWQNTGIDLSAFAGNTIKIRFRAISGSSYHGDIAIDDVYISTYAVPYLYSSIDTLDFGEVNLYNNQFLQTTIFNSGGADAVVTNIIASGDFQVVGGTSTTIVAGGYYSLIIGFSPNNQNVYLDSVLICTASDTLKIMLLGEGSLTSNLAEFTHSGLINVYPNPVSSSLFYSNPMNIFGRFYFTNLLGEVVQYSEVNLSGHIDLSKLPDGIYMLQLQTERNETVFIDRIVVLRK